MKKEESKTFEEAIEQLDSIVQGLERGDIPLNESLEKFKEGIEISKYCNDLLDKTEKEITILLKDKNGELKEQKFELGE